MKKLLLILSIVFCTSCACTQPTYIGYGNKVDIPTVSIKYNRIVYTVNGRTFDKFGNIIL